MYRSLMVLAMDFVSYDGLSIVSQDTINRSAARNRPQVAEIHFIRAKTLSRKAGRQTFSIVSMGVYCNCSKWGTSDSSSLHVLKAAWERHLPKDCLNLNHCIGLMDTGTFRGTFTIGIVRDHFGSQPKLSDLIVQILHFWLTLLNVIVLVVKWEIGG
jgi:hypothetical protein